MAFLGFVVFTFAFFTGLVCPGLICALCVRTGFGLLRSLAGTRRLRLIVQLILAAGFMLARCLFFALFAWGLLFFGRRLFVALFAAGRFFIAGWFFIIACGRFFIAGWFFIARGLFFRRQLFVARLLAAGRRIIAGPVFASLLRSGRLVGARLFFAR